MQVKIRISRENEAKLKDFINDVKEASSIGVSAPQTSVRFEFSIHDSKEAFSCRKAVLDRVASAKQDFPRGACNSRSHVVSAGEARERAVHAGSQLRQHGAATAKAGIHSRGGSHYGSCYSTDRDCCRGRICCCLHIVKADAHQIR